MSKSNVLELARKLVAAIEKEDQKSEIGKTIEVAGIKWLVLDKLEKGYFAISEDFYGRDRKFDDNCNDWKSSDLRNELNTDLRKKIENELGVDSLVEFERNLLSLDGQTEYGTCRDYVSLISVDEYRKYRKLLGIKPDRYMPCLWFIQ